jgi:hypothetical protein
VTSNTAVVDANVRYSIEITDLLLTMAAERLICVHWSNEILDEVRRNLGERLSADAVEYRITQLNRAFPSALDDPPADLIDDMPVNRKDRHVLALAVHLDIGVIITENLRDFPRRLCEPHGVEAITPDDYLVRHVNAAPAAVEHGPTPEMFFAPGAIADRLAEWGAADYQRRIHTGLDTFIRQSHDWLHLDMRRGTDAFAHAWNDLATAAVDPSVGLLASMSTD